MKENSDCQYANLLWNRLTSPDQEMMYLMPYLNIWDLFNNLMKSPYR